MRDGVRGRLGLRIGAIALTLLAGGSPLDAQVPPGRARLSGGELYGAACANCHGPDGRGVERALLGFEEALPDFTDCDFAVREPDADWVAVAHEGGPVRGFSRMMPAFGSALTEDELGSAIRYIRTLCTDDEWPEGELNFPRALLTEKAFPEDEWVVEAGTALEGAGTVDGTFVYEQRVGPRSQFEVAIPYGWAEMPAGASSDWVSGFGDVVLGLKHALYHDGEAGRIFSLGGEVVLPTGDETKGLGADGPGTEAFASFGQALPSDAFVQAQLVGEFSHYSGGENEAVARLVLGRTFTRGRFGRTWTPMLEAQAKRELEGGVPTQLDIVPQIQVSLNTRQHVLASVGVALPVTETAGRSARLMAYVLLDWFDGGFFEGW